MHLVARVQPCLLFFFFFFFTGISTLLMTMPSEKRDNRERRGVAGGKQMKRWRDTKKDAAEVLGVR